MGCAGRRLQDGFGCYLLTRLFWLCLTVYMHFHLMRVCFLAFVCIYKMLKCVSCVGRKLSRLANWLLKHETCTVNLQLSNVISINVNKRGKRVNYIGLTQFARKPLVISRWNFHHNILSYDRYNFCLPILFLLGYLYQIFNYTKFANKKTFLPFRFATKNIYC